MCRAWQFCILAACLALALMLPSTAQAQCADCGQFQIEDEGEMVWVHFMDEGTGTFKCAGARGHANNECHTELYTWTCFDAHPNFCLAPVAELDLDALSRPEVSLDEVEKLRSGLLQGVVLWEESLGMLYFVGACDDSKIVASLRPSPELSALLDASL